MPKNAFTWIAVYNDGNFLQEYDDNTEKEVSFKEVKKEDTDYFAFINDLGAKIGFNTGNGVFDVGDYVVGFKIDDLINFNGSNDYHDIIQYKRFQTDYTFGVGQSEVITDSFFIGWKKSFETEKGKISFKVVCEICLHNQGIGFEVKISPSFDIDGKKFVMTVNNKEFAGIENVKIKKGSSLTKKIWLQNDDEDKK